MTHPGSRLALAGIVLVLTTSCRPDLVVRLATRTYRDGSIERSVDVAGLKSDGSRPDAKDWLARNVGLDLADRDAWGGVEESAGRLRAEGFFHGVEQLPATLAFGTGHGSRPDRNRTFLDIDERVVIRRWVYRERHGDLYSAAEGGAALDALVELAVEALRAELPAYFGEIDTGRAEALLRTEGRSLVSGLLGVARRRPGFERLGQRVELWSQVLAQHGIDPAPMPEGPTDFWDAQGPGVIDWSRLRLAESLSTPERPIHPSALSFLPEGKDDFDDKLEAIVTRTWGDTDAFMQRAKPQLDTLSGYYGGDNAPRLRFEIRAVLPGELLQTNGTPDGDSILWLLREEDLSFGERTLRAESVELQDEVLRAWGRAASSTARACWRLADLLWKRDPEGALAALLRRAADGEGLDVLRSEDEDEIPLKLQAAAQELADLLDPDVPAGPPAI